MSPDLATPCYALLVMLWVGSVGGGPCASSMFIGPPSLLSACSKGQGGKPACFLVDTAVDFTGTLVHSCVHTPWTLPIPDSELLNAQALSLLPPGSRLLHCVFEEGPWPTCACTATTSSRKV